MGKKKISTKNRSFPFFSVPQKPRIFLDHLFLKVPQRNRVGRKTNSHRPNLPRSSPVARKLEAPGRILNPVFFNLGFPPPNSDGPVIPVGVFPLVIQCPSFAPGSGNTAKRPVVQNHCWRPAFRAGPFCPPRSPIMQIRQGKFFFFLGPSPPPG